MACEFIECEKAKHPVTRLCRLLGVATNGYSAWRKRAPSRRTAADTQLRAEIRAIHQARRGTYGAPRMHAELADRGRCCGRKRVAQLMRAARLVGCHRRRRVRTTQREPHCRPAPDRVHRRFGASAPNRLGTADITYIPTWSGLLSLAVVLDVFSRRIVGWAMTNHLRSELVVTAVEMALWNRRPSQGLIHHSDQGAQYTSVAFGQRCQTEGILPSMGTRGDCSDNAITDACFATLACELLHQHCFRTHTEARTALFDYIAGFYNTHQHPSASLRPRLSLAGRLRADG